MIDELIESAGADLARIKKTRSRRFFLIGIKGSKASMAISRKRFSAAEVVQFKAAISVQAVADGFVRWDQDEKVYVFYPRKYALLAAKWKSIRKSLARQHKALNRTAFKEALLYEPGDLEDEDELGGDDERALRELAAYGLEFLGFKVKGAAGLRKAVATLRETYDLPGDSGEVDEQLLEFLAGFQEHLPIYLDPEEEAQVREEQWLAAKADILDTIDVAELVRAYNDDEGLLAWKEELSDISRGMIGRPLSKAVAFSEDDIVAIALSQKAYGIEVTGEFDMATQVMAHWNQARRVSIKERAPAPSDARRGRVPGQLFVDGVSEADVQQGYMGDCFFVATLASIADRYPDFVMEDLIREVSPGKYRVMFYRWRGEDRVETPIDVDGELLLTEDGGAYGAGFGRDGAPRELWPALVEKAYFEFATRYGIYGGYEAYSDPEFGGPLPWRRPCPDFPDIAGISPPDNDLDDVKYYAAIQQTQARLTKIIDALTSLDDEEIDAAFGDTADDVLGMSDRELARLRRKLKSTQKKLARRVLDAKKRSARSNPNEGGASQFAFQVLLGTEGESDEDFADKELSPEALYRRLRRYLKAGACVTAGSLASTLPEGGPPLLSKAPDYMEVRRPRTPAVLRREKPGKGIKEADGRAMLQYCEALQKLRAELDEYEWDADVRQEAWEYLDELEAVHARAVKWADWVLLKLQEEAGRLFFDHQYVVLDAVEIGGLYFVKMLNPHGSSELRGGGADDGVFLLPIQKFMQFYDSLEYCAPG